ncbi:hypothetical protein CPT_Pasto_017 [Rhizobium phage Pasto]|uniref:Uncharacterized protein n=1 Tax=Rhizobium phage Pasto TaxID=2767575 RepID=A0A7S6U302_9CAUD|nr:hypothetical protein CPT_Pasto_017 [Rhizobium phage Pasto]
MIDKDALNSVNPEVVSLEALNLLDAVSDHQKEVQAVALAITLLAYCRRHGTDPGDIFTVANNVLASKHVETPNFIALKTYIRHEL